MSVVRLLQKKLKWQQWLIPRLFFCLHWSGEKWLIAWTDRHRSVSDSYECDKNNLPTGIAAGFAEVLFFDKGTDHVGCSMVMSTLFFGER